MPLPPNLILDALCMLTALQQARRRKPEVVIDHDEEDKTKTGTKEETNPEKERG